MVSHPTPDPNVIVSNEPEPPSKRCHMIASGSNSILISSDDEEKDDRLIFQKEDEVIFVKSNHSQNQKTKKNKESKKQDLNSLCPLSEPNHPCIRCKVESHPKGKIFSCHCGAARVILHQGRIEGAQVHWESGKLFSAFLDYFEPVYAHVVYILVSPGSCKHATAGLRTNKLLSSYFVKDPALQPVNKNIIDTVCPGLTDETWPRPRAQCTILEFMDSTCSIYRGIVRHEIRKKLFGTDLTENSLDKSQKAQLVATLDARSSWVVKRNGQRNAIYSKSCENIIKHHKKDAPLSCNAFLEAKYCHSLVRALNHKYAKGDNIKFTPHFLTEDNKFQEMTRKHRELKLLKISLESSKNGDFGDFLELLAVQARKGLFKKHEVVRGLIMGCAIRTEREEAGKSLRGMRINAHLDDCLTTLGAMRKSALKLVTKNFVGKTLRCQRLDRAKSKTEIEDGMTQGNFDRAGAILADLGYSGPVAVGSDQTVCVQTLQHHRGFVVGAQGGDIPFNNPVELQELLEKIKKENLLCFKVSICT